MSKVSAGSVTLRPYRSGYTRRVLRAAMLEVVWVDARGAVAMCAQGVDVVQERGLAVGFASGAEVSVWGLR